MDGSKGRIIRAGISMHDALDAGLTITLGEIRADEFQVVRILKQELRSHSNEEEEQRRKEDERRRSNNDGHRRS